MAGIEDERNITYYAVPQAGGAVAYAARKWFFGVTMFDVNFFDSFYQKYFFGVQIHKVFPGTPASSKVESGDIVTRIDGVRVETVAQFVTQMEASATGTVAMKVRDVNSGAYVDFNVTLLPFPTGGSGTPGGGGGGGGGPGGP
jgi:hypothetical protein